MKPRALRVFISARSSSGLIEEVAAARQAVLKVGGELVEMEASPDLQENWLDAFRNRLQDVDAVVFLFDNQTSDSVLAEIETVERLGLPMLGFLKNELGPSAAGSKKWLISINLVGFDNTHELQARLMEYLVRDPPLRATSSNGEAAHAANSVFDLLSDSQVLTILRAVGFCLMGFMMLTSMQWWSKASLETLVAQDPTAPNANQAQQQQVQASFGPVRYGDPFNDLLRGVPTTARTRPGPGMFIFRAGTYSVGTGPRGLSSVSSIYKLESDEQPQHEVRIAKPFAMGMHEIMVGEYALFAFATGRPMPLAVNVMSGNNSSPLPTVDGIPSDGRDTYPVQNVSWDEATAYVEWLSSVTGARYRLPTEAEWELVARSQSLGKPDDYWTWTAQSDIRSRCQSNNIRWQTDLVECVKWGGPVPVQERLLFSITNMIGNVAEWTEDCYRPNYIDAPTDGSAVSSSDCAERVFRGGWWRSAVQFARPAFRAHAPPDFRDYSIGFRVVRELSDQEIATLVDEPQQAQSAQSAQSPPADDESRYPGVVVPDVLGMQIEAANARLKQAGFDPQPMFKNVRDDSPPAEVVSQAPEAGARAEYGATVELILVPPSRANQPSPSRQLPADTPSLRRPREFPPQREE